MEEEIRDHPRTLYIISPSVDGSSRMTTPQSELIGMLSAQRMVFDEGGKVALSAVGYPANDAMAGGWVKPSDLLQSSNHRRSWPKVPLPPPIAFS